MATRRTPKRTTRKTTARRSTSKKAGTKKKPTGPVVPDLGPAPAGQRHWVLDVPFRKAEDAPVDGAALAKAFGARWVPSVGFVLTASSLPDPLRPYTPASYSWLTLDEAILNHDDWLTTPPGPADLTTGAITLRPGQEAAAAAITAARSSLCPEFLDASEVGTGKTYGALAAVKRMGAARCLVIAPATVLESWRLALEQIEPGRTHFVLVNAESLQHLTYQPAATSRTSAIKQAAKAGRGKVAWDVVITDEAHTFKNPAAYSGRTRERVIAGPAGAAPPFLITMSATAGKDPSDLAYLHRGLSNALGVPDCGLDGFAALLADRMGIELVESRFGDGALTWDKDGEHAADDLEATHDVLFDSWPTWAIRRVADWGEPPRHLVPVHLPPAEQSQYLLDWTEFKAAAAKAQRAYAKASQAPKGARGRGKAMSTARAQGLAAQTRYRQKAGLLHAPHVAAAVRDHLGEGHQVAVSCEFHDTARAIVEDLAASGIEAVMYTGENRGTREEERRRFQTGQVRVIVFTPTAGFSLHAGEEAVGGTDAPRDLLVAEPRWAPIAMAQAEGRTHRDGAVSHVYYYFAEGTIEKDVLTRAIEGLGSQAVMMGQDREAIRSLGKAMGVARLW